MALGLQKANFWKRFSAWMLDTMLVILLTTACALPLLELFGHSTLSQQITAIYTPLKESIEAEYQTDLDATEEDYESWSDAQKQTYTDAMNAFNKALAETEYAQLRASYLTASLVSVAIALFISVVFAHFVLPLCLKNGQTLGKKVFGLAVVRTSLVKVSPMVLFIRATVGIYAIETVAVAFLLINVPVGTIAAVLVQALQIGVMIKTPTNSSIHDLLADTAVVDYASQHIFETQEEMLEYRKREKEEAESNADLTAQNTNTTK